MFLGFVKNYISSLLFGVIILIISILPFDSGASSSVFIFPGADKIIHALIYGTFTVLVTRDYLRINDLKWRKVTLLITAILFYSVVIEFIQQLLTSYRSGEVLDVVANLTGIIFGFSLLLFYRRIKS